MLKADFLKKYKHFIAIILIFFISFFCFAWVGYESLPQASGLGKRKIIQDDYTTLTKEITNHVGIKQKIVVAPNERLYGVNLNFHTYNRVCHGMVYVDLLDKQGNVIATSNADMTTLLDNTFKRFIFSDWFLSDSIKEYTLHIYSKPLTADDKIALWKSEKTVPGFSLIEGDINTSGSVAVQYITAYIGGFLAVSYIIFSAILILFLISLYYLIFIKKVKLQQLFLICGLVLGLVFIFFTPQRGAPDEYVHIASAYYNANILLGVKNTVEDNMLTVRSCDGKSLTNVASYNALEWQETYEGLFESSKGKDTLIDINARVMKVFPPLYFAQTIGITLARILGLGYIPMLLMGRLFNLLIYLVIVYYAIKNIPIFKLPLTLISLLPMSIQLAASFSYDTLLIALCFLFIALILKHYYEEAPILARDILLLFALAICIASSKAVYLPLVSLSFIIPTCRFKDKKAATAVKVAILAIAIVFWVGYNSNLLISPKVYPLVPEMDSSVTADTVADTPIDASASSERELLYGHIGENGDSIYFFTPQYILTHIPKTIKLVINTVQDKLPAYVQSTFGGHLGEVIVSPVIVSWLYVFALIIILLLSMIPSGQGDIGYSGYIKWINLFIAFICCALCVAACITWTPINYTHIFGIQGRYFIPVLPLMLFAFSNKNIYMKKTIDGWLIFSFICVNILILLDAFTIMSVNIL